MVTIETVRVEAGPSFLVLSASVGPSAQLTSLPTSDWRWESASSQESPSQKLDWTTTEWQSRSVVEMTSWADLSRVFVKTFEGTCKRLAGLVELQHCVQKQNEPLRDFIQRWTTLYHMVENVPEHQAFCAFKAGVCGKHKAVADEDGNSNRKQKQKAPSTPQAEAAAVTNAKFKGKGKAQYTPKKKQFGNSVLDQPCLIHMKMDEEGNPIFLKHTTRQCRLLIQGFGEGQPSEKANEQDDEDKEDPFPQVHATLMIFADVESKSRLKLVNREVNMATPTNPMFLKWSQTAITFDQSDHPAHVPTPGRQALVADPVVEAVRLRKVLMDGDSSLNIMYADTLKGMGMPMSKLSESSMQFHGVVPGRKAKSLG
ncbi:hypothetical protein ZWY2020_019847 [Hordeum vulgare]|nr:hypothetical protein ZWY2020_019847 [Hordeum vulgare]